MMVVVGILLLTSVFPTFQLLYHTFFPPIPDERGLPPAQCPYKSPQAWLFQRLVLTVVSWLRLFSGNRHSTGVQPPSDPETVPTTEQDQGVGDHAFMNSVPTRCRWLPLPPRYSILS